jgi:2-iminobutanoate/2-iminopropanoate deaminase
MKAVFSPRLAKPAGPFSPAIDAGGFIYVSGQIGQRPSDGAIAGGGVEQETEQVFANLEAILEAAGKTFGDVVRAGVYLTDMKDFAVMNNIYCKYFKQPYPARTTIAVLALPLNARVEIDLVVKA